MIKVERKVGGGESRKRDEMGLKRVKRKRNKNTQRQNKITPYIASRSQSSVNARSK